MVEAMACGTPVIGMRCGSVPEVVRDGVSGFVCDTMQDFMHAVSRIGEIDRSACRADAFARFSASAMADGYEAVYRRTLAPTMAIEQLTAVTSVVGRAGRRLGAGPET